MVEALSNLLRVTLNDDSGLIPLEQELSLVQSYIVIQRIRFDETLDYRLAVEADELKDVLIPKLTLQPLIERSGTIHSDLPRAAERPAAGRAACAAGAERRFSV